MARILSLLSRQTDLLLAMLFIVIILMMVLPLPSPLIDFLVAINITFAILILITSLYIQSPVELSVFPSLLLIATLFRLAISVSTTRMILLNADAGAIIETFGQFVIQGNLTVGLIIFFIITIVQFIVITKGSERVAEVSARFTLDGMPGKQMSIDADLRAGLIDGKAAKLRRGLLAKESQLFGAMDGAMKFVKGDAIAGLIITAVNILGGLIVGVVQNGMSAGGAFELYSVLTVGDGLTAQIPALFLSIAAGIIVTRVASDNSPVLANEIGQQLTGKPRVMYLVGGILLGFCMIPGFPIVTFFSIAMTLFALAFFSRSGAGDHDELETAAGKSASADSETIQLADKILIQLPERRFTEPDLPEIKKNLRNTQFRLMQIFGVDLPSFDAKLVATDKDAVRISNEAGQYGNIILPPDEDYVFERAFATALDANNVSYKSIPGVIDLVRVPTDQGAAVAQVPEAEEKRLGGRDIVNAVAESVVRRNVGEFINIQHIHNLIQGLENDYPQLCKEALQTVPLPQLTEIIRSLLRENVPLTQAPKILDVLAFQGPKVQDPNQLGELVRVALGRQIIQNHLSATGTLRALVFNRSSEKTLEGYMVDGEGDRSLVLPTETKNHFFDQVQAMLAENPEVVLVTQMTYRRHLASYCRQQQLLIDVLSFEEIGALAEIDIVADLDLGAADSPGNPPVTPGMDAGGPGNPQSAGGYVQ